MKGCSLRVVAGRASLSAQTEVRRAMALPSYKDLKFPPLPPIKVPEPDEVTLSNGMNVFLLEDHELPLVERPALIRTGNLFDPADKNGLAEITGEVLRSGGTKIKNRRSDRRGAGECRGVGGKLDGRNQRRLSAFSC